MPIALNIIQIIVGTLVLSLGGYYFIFEKKNSRDRYYIFLMGFMAAIINIFYGGLGFSYTTEWADILRKIGFIGIDGYLICLILMLADYSTNDKKKRLTARVFFFSLLLFDLLTFGKSSNNTYTRYETYMTFEHSDSRSVILHYLVITIIIISLVFLAVVWQRQKKFKRDKRFATVSILLHWIIVASAIPDALYKSLGRKFLPSNPIFVIGIAYAIAYAAYWYYSLNYNVFNITVSSVSSYLFNTINVGVLVCYLDGEIAMINKHAKEMFEIEDSKNISLDSLFTIEREQVNALVDDLVVQGEGSYKWMSRNGQISCGINASTEYDRDKEPVCLFFVINDMTREEALIKEADAASRAKSQFLANTSHEIRTPINVVLGMNEMILRESNEPEIIGYANDIDHAGKSLLSIINELLDVSKIEAGKLELIEANYEMANVIKGTANIMKDRAKQHNLQWNINNDENIPSVLFGDELRIQQIIINLVSNAFKYTKQGMVSLDFLYERKDEKHAVLKIVVTDTGVGMSKEGIKDLYVAFARIDEKKNRNIEGTGLGMTITKSLVDMMNGTIDVQSELQKGSVFTVCLPQLIIDEKPVGSYNSVIREQNEAKKETSIIEIPDAKILVVDDVAMNIKVFTRLMKHTKAQIDAAVSGIECLDLLSKKEYDLVFLDHMMPEMDGIETYTTFKNSNCEFNKTTPFVMLTANAIEGAREEYERAGFDAFLSKPIDTNQLEMILERFVVNKESSKNEQLADLKDEEVSLENENVQRTFLEKAALHFNTKAGLEYSANDESFYKVMLDSFVEENQASRLNELFEKSAWDEYKILAHGIKSAAKSVGVDDISKEAEGLEFALKENDIEYVKAHHECFIKHCYEVYDIIQSL